MQALHSRKLGRSQLMVLIKLTLTLKAPIPQNGQTHSKNSSATADELFECV